jgi:hypothetical protein
MRVEVTVDCCDAVADPKFMPAETVESNKSKPTAASLSLVSPHTTSSKSQWQPLADAKMLRSWVRSTTEVAEALEDPSASITQARVVA